MTIVHLLNWDIDEEVEKDGDADDENDDENSRLTKMMFKFRLILVQLTLMVEYDYVLDILINMIKRHLLIKL